VPWASCLRCRLQALCLSTKVALRRGLLALRLGIGGMLGRRLWALRLSIAQVSLISLTSEAWTDDLSSIIFRQSTEPLPKFLNLRGWLGWILKHFELFFWQQALKTGLAIFWDTLSSILSKFWSLRVYCKTFWSHQRWSSWMSEYTVRTSSVLRVGCRCTIKLGEIANYFCQCTVKLIAEAETEHRSCRYEGHISLEMWTSSEVETRLLFIGETQTSKWRHSSHRRGSWPLWRRSP